MASEDTLLTALLNVQKEIPTLKLYKDGKNPAYKSKYITLDALMDEALPLLNRNGLIWTTMPSSDDRGPILIYKLAHVASKEEAEGEMPLMLDKQNSQGLGSALTYARRQSLMAVLGLCAHEDDDAEKASKPPSEQPTEADRPMTADEVAKMREAIAKSGKDEALLLASAGVDKILMLSHGRKIKSKLA